MSRTLFLVAIVLLNVFSTSPQNATVKIPQPTNTTKVECSSSKNKDFKLVLTSSRNKTSHWVAQIQLEHDKSTALHHEQYEIQLQQHTKVCSPEDAIKISGEITAPPPTLSPRFPGYKLYPKLGYYKLHLDLLNWDEAKKMCEDENAYLAIVNSKEEASALLELFAHNLDVHPQEKWDDQAWLGVHDKGNEGNFFTIHGEPLARTKYVRWATNEPNNYDGNEDCVTLRRNGRLNDVICSRELTFFCEWEVQTS